VFKLEQEEYTKEGIDWKEIKFVDNGPLLVSKSITVKICLN
jgi:myosin heavy subunit